MSSEIEIAKNTVLSSKMLFLAHPGNSKLTEFYPNPSNCTAHVAEALNQHGSYRVSFNQAQFGASQTAIVSCSNLLNNMAIVITVTPGDNTTFAREPGWGFDLLDQVQFSFSNSLMQDIAIPGPLLREYSLYLCKDEAERRDLLITAGAAFNGVIPGALGAKTAVVPLNFLSFIGTQHAFPLDLSVLSSGTVQIRATTRAANQVFVVDETNPALNIALNTMDIVTSTSVLMQSAFTVRNAMIQEPTLIYSLPAKYMNWYRYDIAAGQDIYAGDFTIQLSSLPSGQLEAMFVVVRPKRPAGANPERIPVTNHSGGVSFKTLRLTYGTLTLYDSRSFEERKYYMKSVFDDDMTYNAIGWKSRNAAGAELLETFFPYQVAVIPFTHRGSDVKSGAYMENLPSYGGSQLTLTLRAEATYKVALENAGAGSSLTWVANANDANGYDVYVGYVLSGILGLSNGTIDLQI